VNPVSQIDVVLPVFNPDSHLVQDLLQRKQKLAMETGKQVQLIVVNDGSKDSNPFEEIQRLDPTVEVVHLSKNQGKGAALRSGIGRSTADFTLFTDADFPYTIESMASIIRRLEAGANIALGHREQDYYASVPWFRRGMSELFRFLLREVLRFPVTDTQCGLKGMDAKGREVFMSTRINEFMIDMDFIKRAVRRKDLNIQPVVVNLRPDVTFSKMGLKVILREFMNFLHVLFT